MAKNTLTIQIDLKDFDKKVKKALISALNGKMSKVAGLVEKRIKKRFKDLFDESLTFQSLDRGQLFGEFGMNDAKARIDRIVEKWIEGLLVTGDKIPIRATHKGLKGGFKLQMVKSDWSEVLRGDTDKDLFVTPEKGHYRLDWLKWLLTEGDKKVVREFHFEGGNFGRTGEGHMLKGMFWQVPAEFRGTSRHNFATEVIEQLHSELEGIFSSALKRVFK